MRRSVSGMPGIAEDACSFDFHFSDRALETDCPVPASEMSLSDAFHGVQLNNCFFMPGLTDVHVHLREPGFSYKETIATGTAAAARGGYTAVCTMPNLDPVPDKMEALQPQLDIIKRDALIPVYPYGSITKNEAGTALSDMAALASLVVAFSDDGRGVQDRGIMREAMEAARALGKLIVAHCEDDTLLNGGYVHDGDYARAHGHRGISSASEYAQVERDLELVRDTGCGYHICHVSTAESVALLKAAKREGLNVTCETAPHYLVLDDSMLREDGRFKMNPPIRSAHDRAALIEGLLDGTVDMIATDHAPHSAEEKAKGLAGSAMGVVGLECAFPVLYTGLVQTGILSLEALLRLMSTAPRERFGIRGGYKNGDFTVYDLSARYAINPDSFLSKGRATPFAGMEVYGRCIMTVSGGKAVWQENLTGR